MIRPYHQVRLITKYSGRLRPCRQLSIIMISFISDGETESVFSLLHGFHDQSNTLFSIKK